MKQSAILASSNKHKLEEIQKILSAFDFELLTLAEVGLGDLEIIEDGETFEENSYIKAKAVMDLKHMVTIADDSGLEVDYLHGAPGVYSARYAGEHVSYEDNNKKLLKALEGVSRAQRTARFVTVITMLFENGDKIVARGEVSGIIETEIKGNGGFGYDPLFYVPEIGKTFAECTAEEKNKISHRANALIQLKALLKERQI
ncbi:XTP/dITP diphosphatase [Fusibacter ferrireducens]|uniref:dITP/XTP pyrophosphatase n=1 Tax=Fusibacter ferrireducens TaxID=2785058 RepID=A0ABR9ZZA9_9FIRM|nr:XTP/dITP diphosphatase [Fusibacter ferrireducens]MBF4695235.1 XTP/dITP diphosphatase [Fusibacter ferrireducens]